MKKPTLAECEQESGTLIHLNWSQRVNIFFSGRIKIQVKIANILVNVKDITIG